jgi:hypothetical protein
VLDAAEEERAPVLERARPPMECPRTRAQDKAVVAAVAVDAEEAEPLPIARHPGFQTAP